MPDRRWSDADRELATTALALYMGHACCWVPHAAAAVLDALTAAGWRREAEVRAEVSTEIAAAVRQQLTEGDDHG